MARLVGKYGQSRGWRRNRLRTFLTAFGVGWQGSMAIDRLVELDGGRILVELSFHPTGTASGVSLDQAVASIYTVRGDRVVHAEFFMSHEAARAAAGLE